MEIKNTQKLLSSKNLNEFVTMFFGLSFKEKASVFNQAITIKKGTKLYRIRKDAGKDLTDEKEWIIPGDYTPPKNRFNADGEFVLYLSTDVGILPRECELNEGDDYWLAEYTVTNDFEVGILLKNNDEVAHILHLILSALHDNNKFKKDELILLEQHLSVVDPTGLNTIFSDLTAPLYLSRYIKQDIYDISNKMWIILKENFPNGIRYNSSYFSMFELSGFSKCVALGELDAGNLALTECAMNYVKYERAVKKICTYLPSLELLLLTFNNFLKQKLREFKFELPLSTLYTTEYIWARANITKPLIIYPKINCLKD